MRDAIGRRISDLGQVSIGVAWRRGCVARRRGIGKAVGKAVGCGVAVRVFPGDLLACLVVGVRCNRISLRTCCLCSTRPAEAFYDPCSGVASTAGEDGGKILVVVPRRCCRR